MSKRLGHTKVSTTMNIYVSIFREADEQAAEALNVSFGGGKNSAWAECGQNSSWRRDAPPINQTIDFIIVDGWPSGLRHRS